MATVEVRADPLGSPQDAFFPEAISASMPTIVSGEGVFLIDNHGRRLIDVCSGPFLAMLGQGNERVLTAMHRQGRQLTYVYSRMTRHPANADLSRRLLELAGPGFDRVHLTSGGSEANEMALKMLRAHAVATGQPQRDKIISLMPGYQGGDVSHAWPERRRGCAGVVGIDDGGVREDPRPAHLPRPARRRPQPTASQRWRPPSSGSTLIGSSHSSWSPWGPVVGGQRATPIVRTGCS